eukprot:UN09859
MLYVGVCCIRHASVLALLPDNVFDLFYVVCA